MNQLQKASSRGTSRSPGKWKQSQVEQSIVRTVFTKVLKKSQQTSRSRTSHRMASDDPMNPMPPEERACFICGEEYPSYYQLGSHLIRHGRERRRARARAERSRSPNRNVPARRSQPGEDVRLVITVEMVRDNGEVVRRLFRTTLNPFRRPASAQNEPED